MGEMLKMGFEAADWIKLNQDRDKLWAFVNAVMNVSSIICG